VVRGEVEAALSVARAQHVVALGGEAVVQGDRHRLVVLDHQDRPLRMHGDLGGRRGRGRPRLARPGSLSTSTRPWCASRCVARWRGRDARHGRRAPGCLRPGGSARRCGAARPGSCGSREDPPVLVKIVDAEEKIQPFLPVLDWMVRKGLVTVDKARSSSTARATRRPSPEARAPATCRSCPRSKRCGASSRAGSSAASSRPWPPWPTRSVPAWALAAPPQRWGAVVSRACAASDTCGSSSTAAAGPCSTWEGSSCTVLRMTLRMTLAASPADYNLAALALVEEPPPHRTIAAYCRALLQHLVAFVTGG